MNESIVAKTTITVPVNGGTVETTIETVPYWTRSRKKSGKNIVDKKNILWDLGTKK